MNIFFRQLVRTELQGWDQNKVWPLSCFAAQKEHQCMPGSLFCKYCFYVRFLKGTADELIVQTCWFSTCLKPGFMYTSLWKFCRDIVVEQFDYPVLVSYVRHVVSVRSMTILSALETREKLGSTIPSANNLFKVKIRNTRTKFEICSKLMIGVVLVSLFLTLNR